MQQKLFFKILVLGFLFGIILTLGNVAVSSGILSKLKNKVSTFLPATNTPTEEPTDTPMPTSTPDPQTPTETLAPTKTPNPALINLPETKMLTGFKHEYQQWNNCGPVTTKVILSYYGIYKSQEELAKYLRGGWSREVYDDKHVPTVQISEYLTKYDLKSIIRVNGNIEILKALLANEIPVVVYQLLRFDDDIGHYKVAKGYDQNNIYALDSYDGPNVKVSYAQWNKLWLPKNYRFMPVYKADKEEVVRAILGADYDEKTNYQNALNHQLQQLKTSNRAHHWMNAGESYAKLGEWEKAQECYEKAKSIGLPKRELWYVSWPLRVYNQLAEYQKVIDIVEKIRADGNKYPSELLREKAYAQWKMGNREAALKTLETSIYYEPNYTPTRELKKQIEDS